MATRYTRHTQQVGILLNDERVISDNLHPSSAVGGESVYTENTRRAGLPEYDRDEVGTAPTTAGDLGPQMSLEAAGDQPDIDLHVKASKGGMPGEQAEILYRPALDTSASWRGYNTHNVFHRLSTAAVLNRVGTAAGVINYGGCRTADGRALFVYAETATGKVFGRKYDPETSALEAEVTIADSALAMTSDEALSKPVGPVVDCVLTETGRLLCYVLARDIEGTSIGDTTLFVYYSDDNGALWMLGNVFALDTLIDDTTDTIHKLRAAYRDGQACLIVSYSITGPAYHVKQLASSDGLNFRLVEDWQDTPTTARFAEIIADAGGRWSLIYWDTTASIHYRSTGSPAVPFLSAPEETVTAAPTVSNDIVSYSDIDGTHYVTYDLADKINLIKSVDGGATWAGFETHPTETGDLTGYFAWYIIGAASTAVWAVADTGGTLGSSKMLMCEFGGWNRLTEPRLPLVAFSENTGFGGGSHYDSGMWLPTRVPNSTLWTLVGTAMVIQTAAPFGGRLNLTAAQGEYTASPAATGSSGVEMFFSLTVGSTPALSALNVGVDFVIGDGATQYYRGELRFSDTTVRIYDTVAVSTVSDHAVDMTTRQVFKVAIRENTGGTTASLTLYHRSPSDDDWTVLASHVSMVRGAGAVASMVRFGHPTSSTNDSTWHFVHYKAFTGRGVGTATGWRDDLSLDVLTAIASVPQSLYGRPLPPSPLRAYVTGGLHLSGRGGPCSRGDTWKIERAYDYPVSNIFTSSPGEVWRSADTSALVRLSVELSDGTKTSFGSSSYGLALLGVNFQTASLVGWDGAAWVSLVTLSSYGAMTGLPYTRDGNTITVNAAVSFTAEHYIKHNELAGATINLGSGQLRKVTSNGEGAWTDQTTKRPTVVLAGDMTGVPVSGTLDIWRKEMYGLVHDDLTTYEAFAVEIPIGSTVDGYFQIGAMVMGPLAIFATKYSTNRTVSVEPNTEITTTQSGARVARRWGPPRTVVEASWVEGVNATPVQQGSPVPDYVSIRAASTAMMGVVGDAYMLEQINIRSGGGRDCLVYIPEIPITNSAPDTTVGAGPDMMTYGRLVGTASRQTTLGEENESEVVRITGLRIEGEI